MKEARKYRRYVGWKEIVFIIFVFFIPHVLFAHGGYSTQTAVGTSTIEVSYDKEKFFTEELTRFNLNLIESTTTAIEEDIPHTAVWVKLEDGKTILFATWLNKPTELLSGFSYTFPHAGDYILTTRFVRGEEKLAEGSTKISVEGAGVSQSHISVFLGGLIIGGVIILLLGKRIIFTA